MRPAYRDARVAVFDDWLEAGAFQALREFLETRVYFSVTVAGKRGPEGTLAELGPRLQAGELKLLGGPFARQACGTALDLVRESVLARERELEPWLGRRGAEWQKLGAGPRCYPAGRGMRWHDDARFSGTFVLYGHPRWEDAWDGRLAFEAEDGLGRYVAPRPNRCVFLRSGVPHAVLPVAAAAGPVVRASVIGYAIAAAP